MSALPGLQRGGINSREEGWNNGSPRKMQDCACNQGGKDWDVSPGVWGLGSEIWNQGSEIRDQRSEIRI